MVPGFSLPSPTGSGPNPLLSALTQAQGKKQRAQGGEPAQKTPVSQI